jgi:hypothetical protein
MRKLESGIHHIPARPLFLESSNCLVSSTIAVSRLAALPNLHLESDVLEHMQGIMVGDVDVMAVPPEAAQVELRLAQHVARIYGLGDTNELTAFDCTSQVLWCQGAAFHEDAVFDSVTAVLLCEGDDRDLVLPHLGVVVPMTRGTVVLFDSAQPHGLLMPGHTTFDAQHYQQESARSVFCTLDLPRDLAGLKDLMQFEVDPRRISRDAFRLLGSTRVDSRNGSWIEHPVARPAQRSVREA